MAECEFTRSRTRASEAVRSLGSANDGHHPWRVCRGVRTRSTLPWSARSERAGSVEVGRFSVREFLRSVRSRRKK